MDQYLDIAATVLRALKRPMGPKSILTAAYRAGLVPVHLHGKTQHKTLQARISEDIVLRRERSPFFRTAPGRFFLREFLSDPTLPEDFRRPITARRRVRELLRGPALAFEADDLHKSQDANGRIEVEAVLRLLKSSQYHYEDPKRRQRDLVFLWSAVSVCREQKVLSYRVGRYRDDRDPFVLKRSICFSTLVHHDDRTLFNLSDFGIADSGVNATKLDLDIPSTEEVTQHARMRGTLRHFIRVSYRPEFSDLLAVIDVDCPEWFEPMKRRLAINDLRWLDMAVLPNDIDDFDPWSRSIITERHRAVLSADD